MIQDRKQGQLSEIPTCEIVDLAEREEAIALLTQATDEDMKQLRRAADGAWEAELAKLPEWLRASLGNDARHAFLLSRYYALLRGIVGGPAIKNKFVFVPKVRVEDLSSETARSRAAALVAQVQDVHADKISTLVESRFESEPSLRASWMSTDLRQQLYKSWMLAN